jgi:hypothetical protein
LGTIIVLVRVGSGADSRTPHAHENVSHRLALWAAGCVLLYVLGLGIIVSGVLNSAGVIQILLGLVLALLGGSGAYLRRGELWPGRSIR